MTPEQRSALIAIDASVVAITEAGTASTSTVGNTAGAILSCGLFTEGDQIFSGAGTLNATYTARITTV